MHDRSPAAEQRSNRADALAFLEVHPDGLIPRPAGADSKDFPDAGLM